MHRLRVVHRDLKPSNLFVEVREKGYGVKVADFGVCLIGQPEPTTLPGRRAGTLDYMSPEQVLDADRVGPAADLYAVASVLWELIEGVVPFPLPAGPGEPEDCVRLRLDAQRRRPDRPSSLSRFPALYEVLVRALAWEPNERYGSAREFASALEGFVAQWEAETERAAQRAQESVVAMGQRIAHVRGRLDAVKKLDAELEELTRDIRTHGDSIAGATGKVTIAGTVAGLQGIEARLALCESTAARLLAAKMEAPEKKSDRGAGLPLATIASSASAAFGLPSPSASAPVRVTRASLREALSRLSDEERAAFLETADRAAKERRAAEAKAPAKPVWNRYRSEDLLVVLNVAVCVSLGLWAYFDPLVNGWGAVAFVLSAWIGAVMVGAGLAPACALFLPRWRDVDEELVAACVLFAAGASPWCPGLAGALRNWLQADQLAACRLWLSTALIVIVPTLLSCVIGVAAAEIVARQRGRA